MCEAGARWVQEEILDKNSATEVRVYAVWLPILYRDDRPGWDDRILTDPRVKHWRDEKQVASRWFADHQGFDHGPAAWDVYYLYGSDAQWATALGPLAGSDYTIIGKKEQLAADLQAVLDSP